MFDHLRKNRKNSIFFTLRGVAQLVARDVWDVDAAGSNPVTPTTTDKSELFYNQEMCRHCHRNTG